MSKECSQCGCRRTMLLTDTTLEEQDRGGNKDRIYLFHICIPCLLKVVGVDVWQNKVRFEKHRKIFRTIDDEIRKG